MNQQQAIEILNQALDKGFKNGAYSLQDAAYVIQALAVLFPPEPQQITEQGKED